MRIPAQAKIRVVVQVVLTIILTPMPGLEHLVAELEADPALEHV